MSMLYLINKEEFILKQGLPMCLEYGTTCSRHQTHMQALFYMEYFITLNL